MKKIIRLSESQLTNIIKMVISEKESMFQYLDDLRESGQVNMFGSGAYIQSAFGLSRYEAKDVVLLGLTFLVGSITLGSGRTNVMQGAIHLVLFAAFLFLTLVP